MSDNQKIIGDAKVSQEIEKHSPEEFAKAYQELCEKMGWRVVVAPVWIARDDATFSMQLQYTVGQLPKKE